MTDMDEWSDLDEIFVATLRGRRYGSGVVTVSSHTDSKGWSMAFSCSGLMTNVSR